MFALCRRLCGFCGFLKEPEPERTYTKLHDTIAHKRNGTEGVRLHPFHPIPPTINLIKCRWATMSSNDGNKNQMQAQTHMPICKFWFAKKQPLSQIPLNIAFGEKRAKSKKKKNGAKNANTHACAPTLWVNNNRASPSDQTVQAGAASRMHILPLRCAQPTVWF